MVRPVEAVGHKDENQLGPDALRKAADDINSWSCNWLSFTRYDGIVLTANEYAGAPEAGKGLGQQRDTPAAGHVGQEHVMVGRFP